MARYQEMYLVADEELRKLKAESSAVQQLRSHLVMLEASLKILMKHDLLGELATEVCGLQDAVALTATTSHKPPQQ